MGWSPRREKGHPDNRMALFTTILVGTTGFEPATSATPLQRATKLRHVPTVSGRASPSRRDVMYRIDLKKKSRNLTFLYLRRDLVSQ